MVSKGRRPLVGVQGAKPPDLRIPIHFTPDLPVPGRADELLLLAEGAATGWMAVRHLTLASHARHCACCGGRGEAAMLLLALFQARARGEIGFFRAITACLPEAQADALRALLAQDAALGGCYVEAL